VRAIRYPAASRLLPSLAALYLVASAAGCGEGGAQTGGPPPASPPALEARMDQAKGFLARGDGPAAREAFRSIVEDHPGAPEARFGLVLEDELLLVQSLDDLMATFLDAAGSGQAPPMDAGDLIVDTLENGAEPIVRDALEQLEICRGAASLRFPLERLPYRILDTEFLIASGEYDRGDVLLHTAGFHLADAALNTVLSADLDFDFQIVLDHAARWGGMETVEIIRDVVDMLLEILSDPDRPEFLRLRPEGLTRMPRAVLDMGAFLDYRVQAFRAIEEEPISGRRQATGCNDRDDSGACEPGEFIHGFLWSLPAELQGLLSGVRQALRESFLDGSEEDIAPGVPNRSSLDRLNPVLDSLGLPAILPPLPLDLGDLYLHPDPGGVRAPLRTILVLVRLLLGALLPPAAGEGSPEPPETGALRSRPAASRWVQDLTLGDLLRGEDPSLWRPDWLPALLEPGGRILGAFADARTRTRGNGAPIVDRGLPPESPSPAPRAVPEGTPPVGWQAAAGVEALPYLLPGARTLQFSSHDPEGGNDDGFTPPNQLYVDEHGEFVLFDAFGPGCIYRIWFTHTWSIIGNLRLYVDDMERPVLEGPFLLLFTSVFEPFTPPLVGNWFSATGGCFSYLPVPFAKRCKITGNLPPEFFHFTWVRYDADTPVQSFIGSEDTEPLRRAWLRTGEDPKGEPTDLATSAGAAVLLPGASEPILRQAGPGAVWRLFLDAAELSQEAAEGLWLVAHWDGHEEPDVEVPVNEFFGSFLVEETPAGLLAGRTGGRLYCYFPMPFWTAAEIVIENRGSLTAEVSWEAAATGEPYGPGAGYFRALHRTEDPVAVGRDYRIAERQGRAGKWVGITHTLRGPLARWYLEGDERFYVDGSASPAVHGTGTEDYYNGGWYFLMGPFAEPVFGNPWHRVFTDHDETGAFRLHLGDAVHYLDGVRLGIEHGGFSEGENDRYRSVAYFYEMDLPLSRLTDSLDIGDAAGEAAHGYTAPGAAATGEIVSYHEGDDDEAAVSDSGRTLGAESRFRVSLDPENAGAILRRRYDQRHGGQRAEVRVDGRPAGTWYTPESSETLRWAEDDFALPASLTAGREAVEITIEPAVDAAWTEFLYRVYSILPAGPQEHAGQEDAR